jgi:flagellar hook-associated protein 2
MQVAALPQTSLQNQLTSEQNLVSSYQGIASKLSVMQTVAQQLTGVDSSWNATTAASSSSAVIATSGSAAAAGSTTFDVTGVAAAQVSTIAADSNGNVVADPTTGITITGTDNVAHTIKAASGSATDVAAAINTAGLGIRAAVVATDTGQVLQLTASTTGTKAAFSAGGFVNDMQNVVPPSNAQITVGTVGSGGYTVTSQTNTFANAIPGVTFTVGAKATAVTITVTTDSKSISDKVAALVSAANDAAGAVSTATAQGAKLQGHPEVASIQQAIVSAVSKGANGKSLSTYGINIDDKGVLSFDATAFASAYSADPVATQAAVGAAFAATLNAVADSAIAPSTGSLSVAIDQANGLETSLNKQINDWTSRLADIKATMQIKYNAMETALGKLNSQQTYLTSVFNSLNSSSSSSSSSS